ncbi:AAA family ATPase [Amycolatopsis benzoatilytica]|uniref:AAA family ATPase n=1 Tax=Amycolatopsis benzoatilytica TaxID=346045 RepID=UPI00036120A6|nr:LuxR family transcriptional regulator [Amycolatopsis benzoatilytica]
MALFGRELERKQLAELIDGIGQRGGALVVRGEAGIGKSALLADASAALAMAQLRVLTAVGTESERHLPYAGLHQLLYPLRREADGLPAAQRDALRTALGLSDGEPPQPYLVGLAVLNLVAENPLVLIVEDAHWLDSASRDVLAFVARRLDSEPVLLLLTERDDAPSAFTGLPSLTLPRLPDAPAGELLDAIAPALPGPERSRILAEAAGNPLALKEMPHSGTGRLEQLFADRAAALPAATRRCLLIAALNDSTSLPEALKAAAADLEVLAPAASLVEAGPADVVFRHPLMRSAIANAATAAQRRAAHHALAGTLAGQPERRVWHRAAAAVGTDEAVAEELDAAAGSARRRGGVAAAIAALEQAARLSENQRRRADRLLFAAELAVDSGQRETVDRLLAEAAAVTLTPRQRALATWLPTGFDDGVREGVAGPGELADLAAKVAADGDLDLAIRIFWGSAMRCFWVEPGAADRERLIAVADRLPVPADDPRMVAIAAYLDPLRRGDTVIAALRHLDRSGAVPQVLRFLASAAMQVGAFDLAARFAAGAQPGLRAEGRLGLLARTLGVQAYSLARLGDLPAASVAAEEAGQLGHETRQPYVSGLARAVQAEIAALRGDYSQAEKLAAEAEAVGLAAGARPVLATVQLTRGLVALGQGRHADAVTALLRVHDPADPAYQFGLRCYLLAELAEAAVHADRVDEGQKLMQSLETARTTSPALHSGLRYARAVLSSSEENFRTALEADLTGWPLERGRVQLAYGEWLRRQRRAAESRPLLRAAKETFDALGVLAWSERAARELRATGETVASAAERDRYTDLTAHELNIARLAAEGLTNREIGQQLYLSHRTVSTHLHRIFPKLGITSRTELRDALDR